VGATIVAQQHVEDLIEAIESYEKSPKMNDVIRSDIATKKGQLTAAKSTHQKCIDEEKKFDEDISTEARIVELQKVYTAKHGTARTLEPDRRCSAVMSGVASSHERMMREL